QRSIFEMSSARGSSPTPSSSAAMERWRWLPRDLGASHVKVNIPAYRVRVSHDGKTAYEGRVIVGKPGNPTPIFSDEIEHLVVNPYWNIPFSIASKEMLGGIQKNPAGYLARRGYEVVHRGRVVNPSSLSWSKGTLRNVRIRQRPGRRNALGAVKFMFPNKHAVYLHDTPTKHLFKRGRRAFSHGCVRVDQPFVFAEALLADEEKLSGKGLRRMVGGGERYVHLERHIPVHLTYFTREVGADGKLVRLADVYGYDRRTRKALGL
ncbi:MAG: L,D-transpeptidase family protein, partial [Pseudomonadota bacterium]